MFMVLVGSLMAFMNTNYATYIAHRTRSKRSILEFVTGKYLATQFSKVMWDWEEPQHVGKTVSFRIKVCGRGPRGRAHASEPT